MSDFRECEPSGPGLSPNHTVHRLVPALLQRANVRRILEAMQSLGPCTRVQLRELTGISAPTVSKLVQWLEDRGVVEADRRIPTAGRPSQVYRLANHSVRMLGVVVDIDNCRLASAGIDGQIDPEKVVAFPTPRTYAALIDRLAGELRVLQGAGGGRCAGIGLTLPGLFDYRSGRTVFSPNLHLLDSHQPGIDLQQRLGCPVSVYHEEHALCLAEESFGAARNLRHFVVIDISSGLGMGVMCGDRFIRGCAGFGGELGHIIAVPHGERCGCGNRGCLETVATDRALALMVSQRLRRTVPIDEIIHLVRNGKLSVEAELEGVLTNLARGVGIVVNLFNPSHIFIHGRMFDLRSGLFEEFVGRLKGNALAPSLQECRFIRAQGNKLLGAVAGAIESYFESLGPRIVE